MKDLDPERDLTFLVREAHSDWKAGKKVLIRCQAGINRSGLITALVLIRDGHTPREAIALIRSTRCEAALTNSHFEEYLLNVADVGYWRQAQISKD
jgi:protein-tyrosine phosphatase